MFAKWSIVLVVVREKGESWPRFCVVISVPVASHRFVCLRTAQCGLIPSPSMKFKKGTSLVQTAGSLRGLSCGFRKRRSFDAVVSSRCSSLLRRYAGTIVAERLPLLLPATTTAAAAPPPPPAQAMEDMAVARTTAAAVPNPPPPPPPLPASRQSQKRRSGCR